MKIYQEQELSPKPKRKLDRKEFIENLIDSLINIDWAEMVRDYEKKNNEKERKKIGLLIVQMIMVELLVKKNYLQMKLIMIFIRRQ